MSDPQEINLHGNTLLHNCYVLELPKSGSGSLPVDFRGVAFHVPIIARDRKLTDITRDAARHYVTKRGHPGRDNILKVIDVYYFLCDPTLSIRTWVDHYDDHGLTSY